MKIGFDGKRVYHNFRGIGNYSRTLVENLVEIYPENEYFLFSPPFSSTRALNWQKKYKMVQTVLPQNVLSKIFPSVWRSLFLTSVISQQDLDIYHGVSHELPPGIFKSKVKTVVTIHDLLFMRNPEFFPWIDRQVYKKKFKFSCEVADCVVAITNQTRDDLIELLNVPEEKIRVVYQSCNPIFYQQLKEQENQAVLNKYGLKKDYILHVGAYVKNKNAINIIKAFAQTASEHQKDLILVGKGDSYKKTLVATANQLKVGRRVKFIENPLNEELPAIYQSAILFVFPSFSEGFGIPIVEAMCSKVPVITTGGKCFQEAGGETSVYIDPHNVEEIAKNMLDLLVDENKRKLMIDNGFSYVQQFNYLKTTKMMMNIYRELL
ncbi:MAG: glycosyltransferase family 4 protein [Bacteriovoracaceae bacterium]|nr:glycosyltransferase family 4 protein [Bacteriovoracaceae bacterium]